MDTTSANLLDPKNPSGPVKINKLRVTVDRNLCIGAATCIAVAPKTYVLDSEAKAIFINTAPEETEETIIDSAKACPVAAIIIQNEAGQQVFPA
ncbi:ferredoxin [Candidatus Roizmanbacteria bacterium CG_4_10_14_0_8_um_filter_39_9]|uniref:Ferredoxin n=1 Tax=Candidatus Roizmanbacteria bacterium CG_4_10_14_0_8_um_filter_39_9 TaxID=1974829 RepID=A0A2M7QD60_9BACT|nr:MAG: ferredoxin [Candidatus Roizmanbacteria bacterium CG_4_10_14_0_8_um_filter_39_9]